MIIWIYGQPGSGKTTLACKLHERIPQCVHLDEEHVRAFLQAGPHRDELTFYEICKSAIECAVYTHSKGGDIIVSMTTPLLESRTYLKKLCPSVKLVYLWYNDYPTRHKEHLHVPFFDYPLQSDTAKMINTSDLNLDQCFDKVYDLYRNGK